MKNHSALVTYLLIIIITSFSYAKLSHNYFIVAKDGTGDFLSIQEAINSIPALCTNSFIIFVKNGLYNEKLYIEKNNLVICGENRDSTIIQFAELRKNWRANHNNDDYGSAVVNIKNNITDIIFKSLTIINNYGELYDEHDHAFTIRGFESVTRIIFEDCSVISYGGDTVSLWNKDNGMYYHDNCYFEGWVDYVCPRGYCLIENSKFYGHNLTASIWHDGSQNKDQKFVIKNSRFDGVKGFPLGRFHWDAQFYLIDCTFSSNLADKQIFFASSNPPRNLKWGKDRIYYSNCKVDGKDYSWMKDNLDFAVPKIKKEKISVEWVFNGKWNPKEQLEKLDSELEKLSLK